MIGLSAQASAAREYYLVGLRHIYMFDVWPDTHRPDRQAIEETYSGAVASAQQLYDADMASIRTEEAQDNANIHQVDRDAVQQNLEQDIATAADTRDDSLGQLYVQCDYVRATHPELQVDQDGPYEVVGCDVGLDGEFIDLCFYRPYHLYPGSCPFGWSWGIPYPDMTFAAQIQSNHTNWLGLGSPVFGNMYHSGAQVNVMAPIRLQVIVNRSTWAGGRPPMISDDDRKMVTQNRALQRKAGIRPPLAHPGMKRIRSVSPPGTMSKYTHGPAVNGRTTAPASRYSHLGARAHTGGADSNAKPAGSTGQRVRGGATSTGTHTKKSG